MGLFRAQAQAKHIERRSSVRYRVDCPAQLRMPMGDRQGWLYDISQDGARFTTNNPPPTGTSGLLEWETHEAFGKIIWSNEDGCGIEFERPISRNQLEQFASTQSEPSGPVAKFGNIPVAPKGRRGLVSRD
ncbi:PilZ domain-containing protein [Altererythrobacter sp. MF3-039]|uniref:PilZ domain-containing protein n=1 Tax=Altererythrobacter sp. MF3-039 TaxID=3252901 RepID=UPI00390C55A3